jgi:hypothetical protein
LQSRRAIFIGASIPRRRFAFAARDVAMRQIGSPQSST